jgi:hypothetical protein
VTTVRTSTLWMKSSFSGTLNILHARWNKWILYWQYVAEANGARRR